MMRNIKNLLLVYILLQLSGLQLFAQKDTILVFHPSVSNMEMIYNIFHNVMGKNQIDTYFFKGIYHHDEMYNYQLSMEFLENPENRNIPFCLKEIHGNPGVDDLFRDNVFSPQFNNLFKNSIGAIFLGGPDIPPAIYQEKMHLLTVVTDPWRHYMEISALSHLLGSSRNQEIEAYLDSDPDFVVLGICLGMQSINVACGGTLIQDIPEELYGIEFVEDLISSPEQLHRNYSFDDPSDKIKLTGYHVHPVHAMIPNQISKKLGLKKEEELYVLSSHHQAIENLGQGLFPVLWSSDEKIIEAVKHEKYPSVIGLQFHPEKIDIYDDASIQRVAADSSINFNSFLKEHHSLGGHIKFWNYIAELFRKNKR